MCKKRKMVKPLPVERPWKAADNLEEQVNVKEKMN